MLFSWIGSADLAAMAASLPAKQRQEVLKDANRDKTGGVGPVKTLLSNEEFGEVHLLCNYSSKTARLFKEWLGIDCQLHNFKLSSPTDYVGIFEVVNTLLAKQLSGFSGEATFFLSPGTPAMAATWVLLSKSLYPARLVETFNGAVNEVTIPFDIRLDLIPQLLHNSDSLWTHLASQSPKDVTGFEDIVGESPAIREVVGKASKFALRDVTALILGESGTGKELFAHAMHAASHRRKGPFVAINCAALSSDLIESELFGSVKGAFTGADKDRDGAFQQADKGTLFLDEIGECSLAMQAKLLRVLQPPPGSSSTTRRFRPVGSSKEKTVDVKVISATNRALFQEAEEGRFREDLLWRIANVNLKLPPLRERGKDAELIAEAFLESINLSFLDNEPGYVDKRFSRDALQFISSQSWKGNVRSLYNCLLEAAILSASEVIGLNDIASALTELPTENAVNMPIDDGFELEVYLDEIKGSYLKQAIRQSGGKKIQAARLLGYNNHQTLDNQLSRLGLSFDKVWNSK